MRTFEPSVSDLLLFLTSCCCSLAGRLMHLMPCSVIGMTFSNIDARKNDAKIKEIFTSYFRLLYLNLFILKKVS